MKAIKIVLMSILLLTCNPIGATSPNWWKTRETVTYKGNIYYVSYLETICSIQNKKYYFNPGNTSSVLPFEGESLGGRIRRVQEGIRDKADSIALSVFTPEQAAILRHDQFFCMAYYFNTKDSGYAGVDFSIDTKTKYILTVERAHEIEQKLKASRLNAGRQNLEEPNKKYFSL